MMMQTGSKSYFQWALCVSASIGQKVSKQAIFKRMNKAWVKLVKTILAETINQIGFRTVKPSLFCGFRRVLLQDSSTVHLPTVMKARFKGNVSRGEQKAVAKINVVMDALSGLCPVLKLTPFTKNEQSLSGSIIKVAQKGDLVIRDLGYFVLPVLKQLQQKGVYFLSRLKHQAYLYEPKSGQKIQLALLLKGKSWLDIEVLCGKREQLKVRLVAIKLSSEQAAERKRKAKKDRDKRLNHSAQYYRLLDYVIFITTVDDSIWNYKEVAAAYRLRWNIEIVFKSWKSNFKIEHMIPEDFIYTERIESFLYLILLYITWFQLLIYIPLKQEVYKQKRQLSIMRVTQYVMTALNNWLFEPINPAQLKMLAYFCCYDKRAKPNAMASFDDFYIPLG